MSNQPSGSVAPDALLFVSLQYREPCEHVESLEAWAKSVMRRLAVPTLQLMQKIRGRLTGAANIGKCCQNVSSEAVSSLPTFHGFGQGFGQAVLHGQKKARKLTHVTKRKLSFSFASASALCKSEAEHSPRHGMDFNDATVQCQRKSHTHLVPKHAP